MLWLWYSLDYEAEMFIEPESSPSTVHNDTPLSDIPISLPPQRPRPMSSVGLHPVLQNAEALLTPLEELKFPLPTQKQTAAKEPSNESPTPLEARMTIPPPWIS